MSRPDEPRKTTERLVEVVENWVPPGWYPLAPYDEDGNGAATYYRDTLGWENDDSGIYLFRCENKRSFEQATNIRISQELFYVGRAGLIARRLNRHLKVEKHNSASLVYKMTALGLGRSDEKRQENMENQKFLRQFRSVQQFLRQECEMTL